LEEVKKEEQTTIETLSAPSTSNGAKDLATYQKKAFIQAQKAV
jgi:hypothetical protein